MLALLAATPQHRKTELSDWCALKQKSTRNRCPQFASQIGNCTPAKLPHAKGRVVGRPSGQRLSTQQASARAVALHERESGACTRMTRTSVQSPQLPCSEKREAERNQRAVSVGTHRGEGGTQKTALRNSANREHAMPNCTWTASRRMKCGRCARRKRVLAPPSAKSKHMALRTQRQDESNKRARRQHRAVHKRAAHRVSEILPARLTTALHFRPSARDSRDRSCR